MVEYMIKTWIRNAVSLHFLFWIVLLVFLIPWLQKINITAYSVSLNFKTFFSSRSPSKALSKTPWPRLSNTFLWVAYLGVVASSKPPLSSKPSWDLKQNQLECSHTLGHIKSNKDTINGFWSQCFVLVKLKRFTIGQLVQLFRHYYRWGRSGVRLPGWPNRTQCSQRLATSGTFLRSAEMGPAASYTLWRNNASMIKNWLKRYTFKANSRTKSKHLLPATALQQIWKTSSCICHQHWFTKSDDITKDDNKFLV